MSSVVMALVILSCVRSMVSSLRSMKLSPKKHFKDVKWIYILIKSISLESLIASLLIIKNITIRILIVYSFLFGSCQNFVSSWNFFEGFFCSLMFIFVWMKFEGLLIKILFYKLFLWHLLLSFFKREEFYKDHWYWEFR